MYLTLPSGTGIAQTHETTFVEKGIVIIHLPFDAPFILFLREGKK
jgi:hypothetical protein